MKRLEEYENVGTAGVGDAPAGLGVGKGVGVGVGVGRGVADGSGVAVACGAGVAAGLAPAPPPPAAPVVGPVAEIIWDDPSVVLLSQAVRAKTPKQITTDLMKRKHPIEL